MKFKIKHSFYYYADVLHSEEYILYTPDPDRPEYPWKCLGTFTSAKEAEKAAKRIAKLKEPDVELEF